MLRLVFALVVACFATTTASAQAVLVQKAPTYASFEQHAGHYYDSVRNLRVELNQSAITLPGGQTIVRTWMTHNGRAAGEALYNPATRQTFGMGGNLLIAEDTPVCTALPYPVIAGARYTCTGTSSTNGKKTGWRTVAQYDEGAYLSGVLTGYCVLETTDEAYAFSRTKTCYTPDGKWITEIVLLEYKSR